GNKLPGEKADENRKGIKDVDDLITIQPVEMKDIKELAALEACCFPKEEAADEQALRQRACAFPDSFLVMKRDGAVIG
ncbi:hypothetical protein LI169_20895, partial [Desulfovibrio desulfuricans]|nr:hypothetical protein [Desulfovibrio desulfuricans]